MVSLSQAIRILTNSVLAIEKRKFSPVHTVYSGVLAGNDTFTIYNTEKGVILKPQILAMVCANDATVANRYARTTFYQKAKPDDIQIFRLEGASRAASLTWYEYDYHDGITGTTPSTAINYEQFPNDLLLGLGDYITFSVGNGQAGDSLQIYARFLKIKSKQGLYS